ncbi:MULTISPECIES: TrbI/VirB10 family protein [Dyella]|uniref:TrbI/VirB10 family protein n=1 Tax=Dyella TaxID=231454 RepID=UPI000C8249F0|nr:MULTISPECIES: TrbI/VirB10 family protein [Dyella]MDR3444995.1 TrbI/VirB10 family protein [Dyella sp.]PMQ05046.1 Type IV secretion system protein virB10 [Dyella sp. AD56]ULU26929.1 TrbI/VirB10 family protein [Dyella terrae]
MNHYEEEQQGNGGSGQGVPPREPSGNANPYAAHHQQQSSPDLDAGAPQLKSNELRSMNRSAMGMLAALAGLLVFAGAWMFFAGNSQKNAKPQAQKEETVRVPEAPKAPPLPLAPAQPQQVVQQPIALAPPLPQNSRPAGPVGPHEPTLLERRIAAAERASGVSSVDGSGQALPQGGNGGPFPPGMPGIPGMPGGDDGTNRFRMPGNSAYGAKALPDVSNAQPLTHPDSLMLRGTYIRCVLETHIITDIPGFTSCIVTEPVYSFNGKHLLLPKGSKVLGSYSQEPNGPRVAVIWDRIVTPTGIDVNMASPGVDNLGGAGHPGYYNAHWASRISSALLISMLSDAFKYEAAEHGPKTNSVAANGVVVQEPFESNTAQTVQDLANQAVRRSANRPATVTINQGTVVTIYVAKDVDFTGVLARY